MYVLDCSAAVAIVMDKPDGQTLMSLMYSGEQAIAPDLFNAEVAHALCKYVRGGLISNHEAAELLGDAVSMVSEFVPMRDLASEALSESLRLNHSPYDLFYLILARRTGSTLLTLDRRLAKLAFSCGVNSISEVEPNGETWTLRADREVASNHVYTREELLGKD